MGCCEKRAARVGCRHGIPGWARTVREHTAAPGTLRDEDRLALLEGLWDGLRALVAVAESAKSSAPITILCRAFGTCGDAATGIARLRALAELAEELYERQAGAAIAPASVPAQLIADLEAMPRQVLNRAVRVGAHQAAVALRADSLSLTDGVSWMGHALAFELSALCRACSHATMGLMVDWRTV
jgi:hypothetical protein